MARKINSSQKIHYVRFVFDSFKVDLWVFKDSKDSKNHKQQKNKKTSD